MAQREVMHSVFTNVNPLRSLLRDLEMAEWYTDRRIYTPHEALIKIPRNSYYCFGNVVEMMALNRRAEVSLNVCYVVREDWGCRYAELNIGTALHGSVLSCREEHIMSCFFKVLQCNMHARFPMRVRVISLRTLSVMRYCKSHNVLPHHVWRCFNSQTFSRLISMVVDMPVPNLIKWHVSEYMFRFPWCYSMWQFIKLYQRRAREQLRYHPSCSMSVGGVVSEYVRYVNFAYIVVFPNWHFTTRKCFCAEQYLREMDALIQDYKEVVG